MIPKEAKAGMPFLDADGWMTVWRVASLLTAPMGAFNGLKWGVEI